MNNLKGLFIKIWLLILMSYLQPIHAQTSFSYQAVVRDSTGAVLAKQLIGVQAEIIQDFSTSPPVYRETHQVLSNDYGVIALEIGNGLPSLGDFESL
ncbi:MAG: Vir protein, partial [Bacteroidota bacterium]